MDDHERALQHFTRAVELEPEEARKFARDDSDFDPIRDEPRFVELMGGESAVAGQADSGGGSDVA
jgi:hypothetical protein